MKCWMCLDTADSREHPIKASDIRLYLDQISKDKPAYIHTDEKNNILIKSVKSSKLTSKPSLCKKCNNQRTQKYDYAWEALSRYLKDNWLVIVKDKHFFLDNVFPNDTKVNAIRVHLFFVKLLGCMIAEYGIPINISGFSNAVLNEKSHRDIFLTFIDASKLENDLGKFVDRTPIEALIEHGIIVHTAIFLYTLYPVSIRVAYLPTKPIRELRYKAWHPRQISNQVNIGRF